jgi:Tfp pilus assembly protein PilN
MIRVNLIPSQKRAQRELIPIAQRSGVAGALLFLLTLGGVGYWYWDLGRQTTALEVRIGESERALVQLKEAAKLVDRAVARKAELSEKIALIDRLRTAQRGPVTLLSTVSRSVTDGLWLMELNQRGAAVQLEGRATSLTAVTDFVERLQMSGAFDRPVEIVTTGMELVDESSLVRFAIKAQAAGTSAAAAAAAAAAATTRKGD